jgi:hypothetical protein
MERCNLLFITVDCNGDNDAYNQVIDVNPPQHYF